MEYININSSDLENLTFWAGGESKLYFLDNATLLKIYNSSLWIELVYAKEEVITALNADVFVKNKALVIPEKK